jgi:Txe/YoeB family toxin of Txe-Axe toxin-antitoxin module
VLNIAYIVLKICFCYRNAKKCKEKIENMIQEIQDRETKMLGMQKYMEKIEADGKVILDEMMAIAVCPVV